jgi:hypothetical protein
MQNIRKHSFSKAINNILFGLSSISLVSCATPATTDILTDSSNINATTDHFVFGNYTSSAWVSGEFDGQKSRQIIGETLHFSVNQSHHEGGLDVGLSRVDYVVAPVSEAKKDLRVCSSYQIDLKGGGRWWAGPKVSVNWQGDEAAKQNGDDWYENYIVEIASSTPDELHDIFTGDYFKAIELPSTTLAESTYRHYKIRFHSWWQFWSVRQDFRETGELNVEPILDVWIANGLPTNRVFDGVKANIETYGDIRGKGSLRMDMTSKDNIVLNCE